MLLIKSKTPSDFLQQVSWLEAMFITYARKQECFIMSISQDGQGPQSKDAIWFFPLALAIFHLELIFNKCPVQPALTPPKRVSRTLAASQEKQVGMKGQIRN